MTDNYHLDQSLTDEVNVGDLLRVLWQGKWIISGFTVFASVIVVIWALSLPNKYLSTALLAPADQAGGVNSLLQRYGGLASLAGVPLSATAESSKTDMGLALIRSRSFINDFVDCS